ncbi:MAG: MFS transporter [Actinophytocola sp.]|nr:MFS transporter [Actinophytocola sp.]
MEFAVMSAPGTRRWWALGALSLVVLAVALPATILSVALPTLAPALGADAADLQWFVSAYTLVLAAGVLPGGLLGDRFGRKKMLLVALVGYAGGSVLAATSTTPGMFIAAQAVLGLGAAFVIPLVLSGIAVLFTAEERPRAVGIWAAANFVALPLGPIVGGWLLSNYWWGWVFLMNLPIIVLAIIAVVILLPESRSERPPALDPVGILTSSAGLGVLTFGLVQAGQDGWGSAGALGGMLGAAGGLRALGARAGAPVPRPHPRRPVAVRLGPVHLGHDHRRAGDLRLLRADLRHPAVLPGGPRYRRDGQRDPAAAAARRHDGRRGPGRPGGRPGRREGHCHGRLPGPRRGADPGHRDDRDERVRARRDLDRDRWPRRRARARHRVVGRAGHDLRRTGRGRVRADAGGAEARHPARRGHPRQRAERRLQRPARRDRVAGAGRERGAGQRVRRGRGGRPARVAGPAAGCADRVRRRAGPDAVGVGRGGRARGAADRRLPAGASAPGGRRDRGASRIGP